MKKTEIYISVFNEQFSLALNGDAFFSLEECNEYLHNYLEWPTATVLHIRHDGQLVYSAGEQLAGRAFQFSTEQKQRV